jgi:hypothetical protein
VIPLACGIGLCSSNCSTHKGGIYFFPHTHKTEAKTTIKIKSPKKSIEKDKRRGKRIPTRNNRDK